MSLLAQNVTFLRQSLTTLYTIKEFANLKKKARIRKSNLPFAVQPD